MGNTRIGMKDDRLASDRITPVAFLWKRSGNNCTGQAGLHGENHPSAPLEWKTLEIGLREELEKARPASAWQKTATDRIILFRGCFPVLIGP